MANFFPSIWLNEFQSKAEFDRKVSDFEGAFSVFDWIDDRLLYSRYPFAFKAYCTVCEQITEMRIDWTLGETDVAGSVHPAWTETATCLNCGLNSRMRALLDYLKSHSQLNSIQHIYLAERLTPLYLRLEKMVPHLTGSEFMGAKYKNGQMVLDWRHRQRIRHEDLTALTFDDNSFDIVLTLDVFEHIPNYWKAFTEIWRVITPGGRLIFTIPFFYDQETTQIRASVKSDGGIVHHLPPEIHGNPVSNEGSLCFQNFGWDILDTLKEAGFVEAKAAMYWGPWQGHLGYPFFVFSALKS